MNALWMRQIRAVLRLDAGPEALVMTWAQAPSPWTWGIGPTDVSSTSETKRQVVVAVAGVVVVAVRRPRVPGVVVPGAAAINPVGARIASVPLRNPSNAPANV